MEVKVNQNIDLNIENSSIGLPNGTTNPTPTNNNSSAPVYQQKKQVEVEEMNLDLDSSSNQNTSYSSSLIGKSLKSIDDTSLKNLLEKAKNPFNPTKKELLEAIYISMTSQCIDNVDLNYSNLREMKNEIDSLTKEIEDTRKNEMYQEVSEAGATRMLFDYMSTTGESLEESLDNFTLAFKCKNEYGDIIYFYGEPGKIIGTDYEILEEISYRDMYGDSESCKKLHEIIPKRQEIYKDGFLGAFGDEQTREVQNITWTQEQKDYYLKLGEQVMSEGYHDYFTDNEETLKLIEKRDTLKYIEEYIDSELNYYLKNIDPYVNAEDFDQHNNYLDNNDALYSICHGGSYKSGYVETKNITNVEDMINILSCVLNNTGNTFQDNIYIHDENGETIGIYKITSMDDTFVHYYRDWKDTLSDEEVQIFNYINNTDGATAAYKYLQDISRNIDQRWVSAERLKDKEWAAQNKFLASVGSVFITPFEGINAAYHSIESLLTDEDLYGTDVYSKGNQLREGVAESIENDALSFFYGTAMSVLDSISLIGLNYLTGGTITLALSAATMGSRAYVSALNDALARGVDNDKAISYAFGASVIETICESYSVGHLMNLEDKIGEKTLAFIKNVAPENSLKSKILYVAAGSITQGLSEGEEELCTEILNTFYDQIICDEKSNFNLAIQSYKAQGMSEDEAILNAFKDEATQCSLSFAGGFLSGVGFGGVKAAKVSNVATKSNVNVYDLDTQIKETEKIKKVTNSTITDKVQSILSSFTNLFKKTSSKPEIVDVKRASSDKKIVEVRRATSSPSLTTDKKIVKDFNYAENSQKKLLIEDLNKQIRELKDKINQDSSNTKDKSHLDELIRQRIITETELKRVFDCDVDFSKLSSIGNMTDVEIRESIQEELNNLNNINENYQYYIDLIKRKEELELMLNEKLKLESSTSKYSMLSEAQQQEVEAKAKDIYNKAFNIEGLITEDIQKLKGSDAYLEGTNSKIKSIESIKEKIARLLLEGNDINKAVSEVNDSLRYTLIVDDITYSNSVLEKLSKMLELGYKIQDVKNSWGNKTYQGLGITLLSPSGDLFELQFHTKDSYNINQSINNELYEISRGTYSNETKNISNEIQKINQELYVNNVGFEYSQVEELTNAINNYITSKKNSTQKIIYTDINKEHSYDRELSAYDDIVYAKYPGTSLPEQCVIDTTEKILEYGPSLKEGLKAIEEKYGKNSIQATTARGTVVMDFIDNNPDEESTNAQGYNAEGFSKIQKRIQSIYEAAGINVTDYTVDVLSQSESTFGISDLKKVSDKVCNEIFKSHHDFWEKADSETIDAMHKYTKGYDDKINTTLRTDTLTDELCPQLIQTLTSQMSSFEGLKENTLLYRGLKDLDWICDGALQTIPNDRLAKVINGLGGGLYEISDNAFASSTPILGQGFTCTRPIVEVTACSKDTKGAYLGDLSLCPDEVEYLVSPGSGNKKVILGAEELGGKIYVFTQILE